MIKRLAILLFILIFFIENAEVSYALRPIAYKLQGEKYGSSSSAQYAETSDVGTGRFILEGAGPRKVPFIPLDSKEIDEFFKIHGIKIYNSEFVPLERLSGLVHIMKFVPAEYIQGLSLRFVKKFIIKCNAHYISSTNTISLPFDMNPRSILHEIGHLIEDRVAKDTKTELCESQWKRVPFLGRNFFALPITVSALLVAYPAIGVLLNLPYWFIFPTQFVLVVLFFYQVFIGNLQEKIGRKTGLFFDEYHLYIRRPNLKKFVSEYSISTPSEFFAEAVMAYVLFNEEFKEAAEMDPTLMKTYQILKTKIFDKPCSLPIRYEKINIKEAKPGTKISTKASAPGSDLAGSGAKTSLPGAGVEATDELIREATRIKIIRKEVPDSGSETKTPFVGKNLEDPRVYHTIDKAIQTAA